MHKKRLEDVGEERLLDAWAAGDPDLGRPAVILTDLKTRYTEQYPFSMFYDELHRELAHEDLAAVGGYSFGDRPLNWALAHFLTRSHQNRLLIWNPSGTEAEYVGRLQKQLLPSENAIGAEQVRVEHVRLPNADVVRGLTQRGRRC